LQWFIKQIETQAKGEGTLNSNFIRPDFLTSGTFWNFSQLFQAASLNETKRRTRKVSVHQNIGFKN